MKIEKENVQEIFELNAIQKGMLYHFLKETDDNLYNVQLSLNIKGDLDHDVLKTAIQILQSNNESLRSIFNWEEASKPLQIVLKKCPFKYSYHDLSATHTEDVLSLVDEYSTKDRSRFNLRELPLRIQVIKIADRSFILNITYHHILYDGWSNGILLKELVNCYNNLIEGVQTSCSPKPSFKAIQKILREKNSAFEHQTYWKNYLKNCEVTSLFLKNHIATSNSAVQKQVFATDVTRMEAFASEHKVTKAAIIYAAFGLLLQRYLNTTDIVFGTTVSTRDTSISGMDMVIGNFIAILPLRLNNFEESTLLEVVESANRNAIDRNQYHNISYHDIKQILGLKSATELYDAVIAIENYPIDQEFIEDNRLKINLRSVYENTSIPLVVNVFFKGSLEIELMYKATFISDVYAKSLANNFLVILNAILEEHHKKVKAISLTIGKEERIVLEKFNNTNHLYPESKTVLDLFEDQVARTPGNTALAVGNMTYTFKELKEKSDKIASYLVENFGIKAGNTVALLLQRDQHLVPVILAILKAGAAYIPIDPTYPIDRINSILEDSQPTIVLARLGSNTHSFDDVKRIVDLDSALHSIDRQQIKSFPNEVTNRDLAYVLYTSGSTGKPKGVMIEHRSLTNYSTWAAARYVNGKKATFALYTSISFDLTVTSIFTPLITGNKIIVYEGNEVSIVEKVFCNEDVDVIKLTPSHLKILNDIDNLSSWRWKGTKILIVGGEELLTKLCREIYNKCAGPIEIYNEYGPTEATVGCMVHQFDPEETSLSVSLGSPIQNVQIYILDEFLNHVPVGVEGEIYITGDGLARGYINNEELTKEKFIANPFTDGERMYKTGDIAIRCFDGSILFKDRLDDQVKVNGFRIELGDIGNALGAYNLIKEAVVVAREKEGEKHLIAYFISERDIEHAHLKKYLSERLPAYMVPVHYVRLEKMPLTINGKLNKKGLPDPHCSVDEDVMPPSGQTEEILAGIWSDVLKLNKESVSVSRSFFEFGGHSLTLILMLNKVYKTFQVKIPINEVFSHPNIRALSLYIEALQRTNYTPIKKAASKNYFKLSSAQKRLYFLHEIDKSLTTYNGGIVRVLEGEVDKIRIIDAFRNLILRHEILRTSFELINGEPFQKTLSEVDFEIEYFQTSEDKIQEVIKHFVRPFDLDKAPLIRSGLIEVGPKKHILIVDVHHIIGDELSQEVLIRDFMAIYAHQTLPKLALQYKDYAEWQQSTEQQKEIFKQKEFWINQFSSEIEALALPTDFTRPVIKRYDGKSISFTLSDEETRKLRSTAQAEGVTLFMLILALYDVLLSKVSGQEDIVVGVSADGRLHADLEGMVGLFINTLPIRLSFDGNPSFKKFLAAVKYRTLSCFDNQAYPYEELIDALKVERNTSRNPLFDAMFVFQSLVDHELQIPGLVVKPFCREHSISKFDLTLSAIEGKDQISFSIEYSTALFKQETIDKFVGYFRKIVSTVLVDVLIQISDIELIPTFEKNQLLFGRQNTRINYDANETIISLFENSARNTPEKIALRYENETICYGELEDLSQKIAAYLQHEFGIVSGDLVGIMLKRDSNLIPLLLGVLKSGGAFLPIDPAYPSERINSIIEHAEPKVLITRQPVYNLSTKTKVVDLDECLDKVSSLSYDVTHAEIAEDSLAYVIYTSGSTGTPKGVMVEHRALLNYVRWAAAYYLNGGDGIFALYTSISFDLTLTSVFVPLITGKQIIIYGAEGKGTIEKVFFDDEADIIKLTPSHLKIIRDSELAGRSPGNKPKKLIVGGEELEMDLAKEVYDKFQGHIEIYNEYGPTESTVGCMIYKFTPEEDLFSVPIGAPIDNTAIYILDKFLKPVPEGVKGEIFVSGVGLAKGYLRDERLTNEKFVLNPFIHGERMYKTGDFGARLPNANVLFKGRLDGQVKLRGFRIELGEIEYHLLKSNLVQEAVVMLRGADENKLLVVYYVAEGEVEEKALKDFLSRTLPDYMVPSYYVYLKSLPLTQNGKLDKKALPDWKLLATNYVRPINETQKELVEIWARILNIDSKKVSVHANFYDMGGNSLKLIRMTSSVNKHFKAQISLAKMFELPVISQIAEYLDKAVKTLPGGEDAEIESALEQMKETVNLLDKI